MREIPQPVVDFVQQLAGDVRLLPAQLQVREKLRRLFDRHRRDLADVRAADLYLPGFAPQAQARAIRAHRIAAIPAEEDPHVQFVLFAFQMLEEATHTPEFAITVDDVILLLAGKVLPRYVLRSEERRLEKE